MDLRVTCSVVNANIANITPDDTAVDGKPWTSKHIVDMLCQPLEVSGNPVQCYPVPGYPLGITASWEPTQEGTGDPSPENIRPIKGRDSVKIYQSSTNLLDFDALKRVALDSVQYERNGETIKISTKQTSSNAVVIFCLPIALVAGKTITISADIKDKTDLATPAIRICAIKSSTMSRIETYGEIIGGDIGKRISITATFPLNLPTNADYYALNIYCSLGASAPSGSYVEYDNVMVEYGNSTGTYIPYEGKTVTLSLPETVCSGSVDSVTGEGQEKWAFFSLKGDEKWSAETVAGNVKHRYALQLDTLSSSNVAEKNAISSHYVSRTPNNTWQRISGVSIQTKNLQIYDEAYAESTVDEWKAYLAAQYAAGAPVQIACKLVTPIAFSATGNAPVSALAGINTILTDADSVEVAGRKDLIHVLEST